MARYNREFLNTYLTDLCSLHFAKGALKNKIAEKKYQIERLKRGASVDAPQEPEYEKPVGCFSVALILFGAVAVLTFIMTILTGNWPSDSGFLKFIMFLVFIVGALVLFFTVKAIVEIKQNNDALRSEYEADYRKYEEQRREVRKLNADAMALVPKVADQLRFYEHELDVVSDLLERAYRVNVIPGHYRDMYAAVYLHDYFTNSGEDDMAMALNTYVLEQIKDKLDRIIEMQSEIMLNQRVQTALQYKTMEEQRRFAVSMERKVARLNATAEEQRQYLGMIEANTSATAYFVAASYFDNL